MLFSLILLGLLLVSTLNVSLWVIAAVLLVIIVMRRRSRKART